MSKYCKLTCFKYVYNLEKSDFVKNIKDRNVE